MMTPIIPNRDRVVTSEGIAAAVSMRKLQRSRLTNCNSCSEP